MMPRGPTHWSMGAWEHGSMGAWEHGYAALIQAQAGSHVGWGRGLVNAGLVLLDQPAGGMEGRGGRL